MDKFSRKAETAKLDLFFKLAICYLHETQFRLQHASKFKVTESLSQAQEAKKKRKKMCKQWSHPLSPKTKAKRGEGAGREK